MPNHVKNRLEFVGDKARIDELIKRYATQHEAAVNKTHDGKLIYKNTQGGFGWLDEKTGVFTRRDMPDVDSVPDTFTPDIEPAWQCFPDFEKIVVMPEIMQNFNPHSKIVTAVQAKYEDKISGNPLLAMLELRNRQEVDFNFNETDQKLFERGCKVYEETGYVYWYDWACDMWGTKWNAYCCEQESDNVFTFDTAWSNVLKLVKIMAKEFPDIEIRYEYSDEDTGHNCGVYKLVGEQVEGGALANGSNEAYELAFKLRPEYRDNYELTENGYEYKEEDDVEEEVEVVI